MGQKVNPHGLRVGVIKDWDSRWFANKSDFGDTLVEDYNVRKFIKKNLYAAGVPKIEIERFADKVRIHIHCAKPGVVIGRGGAEIEKLRAQLEKMLNKQVYVNIVEVKQPDMDAQLVAEKIVFLYNILSNILAYLFGYRNVSLTIFPIIQFFQNCSNIRFHANGFLSDFLRRTGFLLIYAGINCIRPGCI